MSSLIGELFGCVSAGGLWLDQLTPVLVLALAFLVFVKGPKTRPTRAVATLLSSYSLVIAGVNILDFVYVRSFAVHPFVSTAASIVAIAGAVVLASSAIVLLTSFPSPMARGERTGLAILAASILLGVAASPMWVRTFTASMQVRLLDFVALAAMITGILSMLGLAAGLGYRYFRLPPGPRGDIPRTQLSTMSLGLIVLSTFTVTFFLVAPTNELLVVAGASAMLALAAMVWLAAAHASPGGGRARNLALLVGVVALIALVVRSAGIDPDESGAFALTRLAACAIFAYGIVRGQLLGIDMKVRWTISKSTIVAVFIAVFFIASEGAQQFFGETLGSAYVGILAAGGLVFAMAPLQRAAERLAERAVPITEGSQEPAESHAATCLAYKAAMRAAMRDGIITRREERHLAEVARALNIDAVQALEWRGEVETETAEHGRGI